ncbi:MAG: hypothetical protein AB7G75_17770 [Candidatus Binatia bacterium]
MQFQGRVLYADSVSTTPRAAPTAHLYQLNHRLGHLVMEVTRGAADLPYHRLWLNGANQLFETLAAEENRFKDVEITGQLREYRPTVGIVDLPTVPVLG